MNTQTFKVIPELPVDGQAYPEGQPGHFVVDRTQAAWLADRGSFQEWETPYTIWVDGITDLEGTPLEGPLETTFTTVFTDYRFYYVMVNPELGQVLAHDGSAPFPAYLATNAEPPPSSTQWIWTALGEHDYRLSSRQLGTSWNLISGGVGEPALMSRVADVSESWRMIPRDSRASGPYESPVVFTLECISEGEDARLGTVGAPRAAPDPDVGVLQTSEISADQLWYLIRVH